MKIYSYKELIEYVRKEYTVYTLFIKGRLCKRHDNSYICGTRTILSSEIALLEAENSIYKDTIYLLTNIDIDNHYIEFHEIGKKEEILQYLEKEVY